MLDKIVELLGASPTQYRYLLNTEKLVEKRALKGNRFVNLSLGLSCGIFFIVGLSSASMLLVSLNVFTYALISITMSMAMIGIWTIPYFDILIAPIHYPIVAHTPVSSRTYFLVKLTQILTYTVLLLVSFNLPPAIAGIWIHVRESSQLLYLFPLVYLFIAFMSGFFAIGVMTVFAGYLTKLYTKKSLRNIAQYAQFIFPSLFPMVWILLPRLPSSLSDGGIDKLNAFVKWFYALPNGWFAGAVSLGVGEIERHFLILTGLAVVSTLILIFAPLRSIARSYSEYLSYLLESGNQQRSELRVKIPLFARLCRNPAMRAAFCLGAAYMWRDKHILRQLFGAFGAIIILVVLFMQDEPFSLKWIQDAYAIGLSPGFSMMFYFVGTSFIGTFILPVRYSGHWKASWMLTLAPLATTRDLWRGVQATTLLYIVAPCTFLMFCIATFIWGVSGIFYVLPGFTILLYYVIFYPKPVSNLPLAEEFVQKRMAAGAWIPFVCSALVVIAFVGIQYLTYLINIWVYYSFYAVTVVSGLIGFVHFLKKR
ncbi:MAG: hypothetical protein OXH00_00430 [Candidatus Poribacteria bacterium]|nr:hypothetical protein [Candidatus Poribacteria bacterium]